MATGNNYPQYMLSYWILSRCGLETWYLAPGQTDWQPGQCLFTSKPSWVQEELPSNDGAFWAAALLSPRVMYYSVAAMDEDAQCIGLAHWPRLLEQHQTLQRLTLRIPSPAHLIWNRLMLLMSPTLLTQQPVQMIIVHSIWCLVEEGFG